MQTHHGEDLPGAKGDPTHDALLNVWWTGLMLKKAAGRFFRLYGSSEAQFNILWVLKCADQPPTQREISDSLVVDKSNITGLIDRMEAQGLVRRCKVAGDRRSYHIRATAKGRKLMDRMNADYDARVLRLMSRLSQRELKALVRLTRKVRDGLRALGDDA
jgi:DNA-binding MarR family transcriptional regulator